MNKRGEGGISFTGALVLILIVLKLVGVIHCSWWLVFSPVLIEVFLLLIVLVNWDFWSH